MPSTLQIKVEEEILEETSLLREKEHAFIPLELYHKNLDA